MEVISQGGAPAAPVNSNADGGAGGVTNISSDSVFSGSGDKSNGLTELEKAVIKSMDDIRKEDEEEAKKAAEANEGAKGGLDEASVSEARKSNPILAVASAGDSLSKDTAVISKEHRDSFIGCVVSGDRYKETFFLFGRRVKVVLRSRLVVETEAIEAYSRRKAVSGLLKTNSEYTSLVRRCLLVAQVEEVNGVKYREMAEPLFYSDGKDGLESPEWEKDLELWGRKPETLVSAILGCIIEFEARYWTMIRKAEDANFWKTGEYTAE